MTDPEFLQTWRTAIETARRVVLFYDCLSLVSFYPNSLTNLKAKLNSENMLALENPTLEKIGA
jgi:hypothetical protein